MIATDIAYAVEAMALEIFEDCGAASDYCVQHRGEDRLIFGGTNRLILDKRGWRIDRSACTERFIRRWDEIHAPRKTVEKKP